MLEDENMIFLATDLRPPRKISNSFIYFSNSAEKAKTEKNLAYFVQWDSSKVE